MGASYEPFLDFNQALAELGRCRRLTTLRLVYMDFSDESLAALAAGCAQLSELELSNCTGWTAAGFAALARHCLLLQVLKVHSFFPRDLRRPVEAVAKGLPLLWQLQVSTVEVTHTFVSEIMAKRPWVLNPYAGY